MERESQIFSCRLVHEIRSISIIHRQIEIVSAPRMSYAKSAHVQIRRYHPRLELSLGKFSPASLPQAVVEVRDHHLPIISTP